MELKGAPVVDAPATLTPSSVRELRAALRTAAAADGCRAIVLTSANPAVFCEGMDLAGVRRPALLRRALEDFAACLRLLRTGPVVTLGVVRGRATGGGVGLAAACDGVVATPGATFGLPELLFGLTPAIVEPYLLERLRPQQVRWLALSAERLDAAAALRAGLVDRVCTDGSEAAVLGSWVRQARRLDPAAVRSWKRASSGWRIPPGAGVPRTLGRLRDPRVLARFRAFAEKGQPPWMDNDR